VTTLRIFDLKGRVLALYLRDLLDLLAPRSLGAEWEVSAVSQSGLDFEATGEGGDRLTILAQQGTRIAGADLTALAKKTVQVIWGEFTGSFPATPDDKWAIIRAFDSSFYEVTSFDQTVLDRIGLTFTDVRPA
jgi:hypothetical protein